MRHEKTDYNSGEAYGSEPFAKMRASLVLYPVLRVLRLLLLLNVANNFPCACAGLVSEAQVHRDETISLQQRGNGETQNADRLHRILTRESVSSAIQHGLRFLQQKQLKKDELIWFSGWTFVQKDWKGNWPQSFQIQSQFIASLFRFRDISPFVPEFVHHMLTWITPKHQALLHLTDQDVVMARDMRQSAIQFIRRFINVEFNTIGFWPIDTVSLFPGFVISELVQWWLGGKDKLPVLGGNRFPFNVAIVPGRLGIPEDSDVTSNGWVNLIFDYNEDDGDTPPPPLDELAQLFVDWKDDGEFPLRFEYSWMPRPSTGAFLTWMPYEKYPEIFANDIDIGVVANVLYGLGYMDQLHVQGVNESIALINTVISQGIHTNPDRFPEIGVYYPDDYVFQYFISRAYFEGKVEGLQPSVDQIAAEITSSVVEKEDVAYWDKTGKPSDRPLTTAYVVLTLINAGANSTDPLIIKAVTFLVDKQGNDGAWDDSLFFFGLLAELRVDFSSQSYVVAIVLEALIRYMLLE